MSGIVKGLFEYIAALNLNFFLYSACSFKLNRSIQIKLTFLASFFFAE
jgi:hypothetical protein